MSLKIWIDGKLVDKDDAKLSVYDHGTLYGDGVFEGIRVYNGKIFECEAHVKRLFESAKALRLKIEYTPEQIIDAMNETFRVNGFKDCYIRLVVTRGYGDLGLSPTKCKKSCTFVIADTITLYPEEMYKNGMSVITATVIRNHPSAISPRVKSLNYLNNILAKIEANDANVPEAIMLNHLGNVAECTGDNIFIVKGGIVRTPTTSCGILEGITRNVIIDLCGKLGIRCEERPLQRVDLFNADECFLTGTAAEVIPVREIDKIIIGKGHCGEITKKLIDAFHKHVRAH